jgi:hypothetical protein
MGDRSTAFWNPFRRVWVYSIRAGNKRGRIRHYHENPDAATGLGGKAGQPVPWTGADRLDPMRADLKTLPSFTTWTPWPTKAFWSDCSASGAGNPRTGPSRTTS